MNLILDPLWGSGWAERKGAEGTLTVTNGILRASAPDGQSAFKEIYYPAYPGSTVTVGVFARVESGLAKLGLDCIKTDFSTQLLDSCDITSAEFRKYMLSFVLPQNVPFFMIRSCFGKWASLAGAGVVEYHSPSIQIENGYGSPLVLACGLVAINNGTPSISTTYKSVNVDSVSRTDANTIRVTLARGVAGNFSIGAVPINYKPIIKVWGSPEEIEIPKGGRLYNTYDPKPYFEVKYSTGTAWKDISAFTGYFSFELSY